MLVHTLSLARPGGLMPDNDDARVTGPQDYASIEPLLAEIRRKHGDALLAIIAYGSWLRGQRDTMLDFYVLVEDYSTLDSSWQGWMCRLLPPNVYHIHARDDLRAKYALLTLRKFCHAMSHDFHSYFWARFAQPCEILFVRDESVRASLNKAFSEASSTFLHYVLPTMPDRFNSRELWTSGLAQTYRCELRTESNSRPGSIYEFNPGYYDGVVTSLAGTNRELSISAVDSSFCNQSSIAARKLSSFSWWVRRVQGKLLSILRLLKAAFTFNEPLQYLLWKIERHTGIYIEPSARQLEHPLIFAWPLLWRLYRRGAFR